jgi:hypothetical protein
VCGSFEAAPNNALQPTGAVGAPPHPSLDFVQAPAAERGPLGLNAHRHMEAVSITLRVDATASEGVYVEPVGPRQYRLEDSPIVASWEDNPVHAGDVIEVEPLPDGTHRLVRVVERSPMRHFDWVVPRFFYESPEYTRFGAAVESVGGWWKGAFGGALWVHLPPESTFDPEAELSRRIAAARAAAPEA